MFFFLTFFSVKHSSSPQTSPLARWQLQRDCYSHDVKLPLHPASLLLQGGKRGAPPTQHLGRQPLEYTPEWAGEVGFD